MHPNPKSKIQNPKVARHDGRRADELRPLTIKRGFTRTSPGSVLIQAGRTTVLCTASVAEEVPGWMKGEGRGWVTAEYSMLPGSTSPRKPRERGGKIDGRTTEIQRLIGRSLRAIVDLKALGERSITVDCDVLEADGGTRTLSVTGAWVALVDALATIKDLPDSQRRPLRDSVAAVSVGLVEGRPVLDLDYQEDFAASVDMNVVMTGSGRFVEVQGTGEEATFSEQELAALVKLARGGIEQLIEKQRAAMRKAWPF
ncbi:MAG: ribonuclease PH [Planctomycetia bacterium 21-64-5]|nr:MAG: ribonuclease PH [Planctomycetia bacterium 21-64-5]HQU43839.1 ribonuclease PH [Pirellulales bacterium]